MSEQNTIKLTLQHNFNQDEIVGISKELALANQELDALERQKSSVMSDYKARIDYQKSSIGVLSGKINNGFEMRTTDCTVEYHTPKDHKKTITRLDTGESWVEGMLTSDYDLFNQAQENDKQLVEQD